MKFLKNIVSLQLGILTTIIILNANAFDPMAKEETTPPPAEGALTIEQIPPLYSEDIRNPKIRNKENQPQKNPDMLSTTENS